jgi:hypothetical protein
MKKWDTVIYKLTGDICVVIEKRGGILEVMLESGSRILADASYFSF